MGKSQMMDFAITIELWSSTAETVPSSPYFDCNGQSGLWHIGKEAAKKIVRTCTRQGPLAVSRDRFDARFGVFALKKALAQSLFITRFQRKDRCFGYCFWSHLG